ncbi:hypothetical protein QR680_010387 [Steinernema hermaphroditum]|uniref:Cleavage and polyadenylation specificity factor subunit 4 n=1 Tax=Steinernema hermaphroditum TaxID=289476 RepID=A0AA39INS8_9BILA|nr:hypothetical protein QR680_010387 [Steinernema hermaphroditum]
MTVIPPSFRSNWSAFASSSSSTFEGFLTNNDPERVDVETALFEQIGAVAAPFPGMDKSGRGVCVKNENGLCTFGNVCPLRHIIGDKAVVCKHWLRGLCKKGDQCEFLHEYDLSKMPECYFFSKYLACSNKECPFRHIDPETKIKDCPWYDRGFCRHGPYCKHRHRRRVLCPNYVAGFCPDGPECKYTHPSFNIPAADGGTISKKPYNQGIICHNCHERGHKATYCPHLPTGNGEAKPTVARNFQMPTGAAAALAAMQSEKKTLQDVTCYKCGEKGHYANRCHKGVLAFLSNTAHLAQEQRERDEQGRQVANAIAAGSEN